MIAITYISPFLLEDLAKSWEKKADDLPRDYSFDVAEHAFRECAEDLRRLMKGSEVSERVEKEEDVKP